MILPCGVNKASGLAAALEELQLSPHNVVGVGDAENDHAFLRAVGFGVAVDNALPQVKKTADLVTEGARGDGVIELVEHLLEEDAGLFATERHRIEVGRRGRRRGGRPVAVRAAACSWRARRGSASRRWRRR